MKIVAGIPCYNEERFIGSVVLKTKRYVDYVLVVDDGSCDRTGEVAREAGAEVIRHSENMGKGVALNTAIERAKELEADILVLLDGDYQHDPDEIPLLLEPILNGEADIVVGSRFLNNNKIPKYRRLGGYVLTLTSNVGSKVKLTDSQSGFRSLSKKAIENLNFSERGFSVESEMQFLIDELGLKVKETPITATYEDKVKRSPMAHGANVLAHIILIISEKRPLFFFGVTGFIILLLGVGLGIDVVNVASVTKQIPIGSALICVMLIIIGTITTFIGIVLNAMKNMIKGGKK